MSLEIPTTNNFDHLKIPCILLSKRDATEVCMEFGMTCLCNIILPLESHSKDVAYRYSMRPSLYVDL